MFLTDFISSNSLHECTIWGRHADSLPFRLGCLFFALLVVAKYCCPSCSRSELARSVSHHYNASSANAACDAERFPVITHIFSFSLNGMCYVVFKLSLLSRATDTARTQLQLSRLPARLQLRHASRWVGAQDLVHVAKWFALGFSAAQARHLRHIGKRNSGV